ncbi:tail fiber assembly protein [Hafnia paralvei]|uniref:tail fiber assembly protein n=1 Tax=Hafnia paralvei TaxID=546367 RepID=UPI001C04CE96|nr:tail fiber assembly protein [Hafnia paralvei]MBU2675015.1 tail fiber assembly protein [Hafnia paralvei]
MNKTNYIYSPGENAFYPEAIRAVYEKAGSWPDDGIYIEDAVASEYMGEPPEGKKREAGPDGHPVWVEIPPPTPDELVADADAQKQALIDQANVYMNSKQWPGKAAMGRLSDAEKAQYNAWLDYLDALEAVDTSSAPYINWPPIPAK